MRLPLQVTPQLTSSVQGLKVCNALDPISDSLKSTWYLVILETFPTNERLAAIHLADTDSCTHCGKTDTLPHRTKECGEGPVIWNWTHTRIATLLHTNPRHIMPDWTMRPTFHFGPPQKHAAIVWIIAHLVAYRVQQQRRPSLLDYTDFLRRARWETYQQTPRQHATINYLDIL